jgi:hypothetical protein
MQLKKLLNSLLQPDSLIFFRKLNALYMIEYYPTNNQKVFVLRKNSTVLGLFLCAELESVFRFLPARQGFEIIGLQSFKIGLSDQFHVPISRKIKSLQDVSLV